VTDPRTGAPGGPPPAPPARGARYVDLHMHSTASDGALPPTAVVEAARAAGLEAIALTDHDTVAGVTEARAAGERLGVRVVAGVELSAHDADREIHLLGLHLQNVDEVEHRLAEFRAMRHRRAEQIVAKLNALSIPVTLESVLAESAGGAVGRPHIARALIAGRWARDHREAFDRYLGYGRPAYVAKERLTSADAVRIAHDAGGICVFAHPGQDGSRERVERLVAAGLDGLEVRHPSLSAEDQLRLNALVDHFGLVRSGGSDWHGQTEGPRTIGMMQVPADWLERQEERAAQVRARARVA
jgi:3',5'-nucleoside bisphosphate phosphatase